LYSLRTLFQYDFAFFEAPPQTVVSIYGSEDQRLAQAKEFEGKARATVFLSQQMPHDNLSFEVHVPDPAHFLQLIQEQATAEAMPKQPLLQTRRFLWRMLGEFAAPQPLSAFDAVRERLYAATPDRVWGIDVSNPYQPLARLQMAIDGVRSLAMFLDHVYLARPDDVYVYHLAAAWKPAQVAVLELADVRRMAFRGTTAYALHADHLSILEVRNPANPKVLTRIDTPEAIDMVLVGHRAAIASRHGVRILNIARPSTPGAAGSWEGGPIQSLEKVGGMLALRDELGASQLLNPGAIGEISVVGSSVGQTGLDAVQFGGRFAYALTPDRTRIQIYLVTQSQERLPYLKQSSKKV
jgi:hypothetical protein